jgi:hypothetical protein
VTSWTRRRSDRIGMTRATRREAGHADEATLEQFSADLNRDSE